HRWRAGRHHHRLARPLSRAAPAASNAARTRPCQRHRQRETPGPCCPLQGRRSVSSSKAGTGCVRHGVGGKTSRPIEEGFLSRTVKTLKTPVLPVHPLLLDPLVQGVPQSREPVLLGISEGFLLGDLVEYAGGPPELPHHPERSVRFPCGSGSKVPARERVDLSRNNVEL